MRDPALWRRLLGLRLDDPSRVDLVHLMWRSRRWRRDRTERVIGEYRRFLYLTQVAPGEVAPPPLVDRMWEEHISSAGSHYGWMCRAKLRAPLERSPFLAAAERGDRYAERYARTRMHYEREFGAPPPEALWPDPARPVGCRLPFLTVVGLVLLSGSCSTALRAGRLDPLLSGFTALAIALVILPYLLPRRWRGRGLTPAQAQRRMRRIWQQGDGGGDGGGGDGGGGGE